MKTKILIILLLSVAAAQAATMTIEVPAADVPRLTEAFGSILGLGRPATQTEVEQAIKQWMVGQTKDYERRKNMAQYTPPPFSTESPTPTPGGLAAAAVTAPSPTVTPKKKK